MIMRYTNLLFTYLLTYLLTEKMLIPSIQNNMSVAGKV